MSDSRPSSNGRRLVAYALACSSLTACGFFVSFEDYRSDRPSASASGDAQARHSVGGTVDGLPEGATIDLQLNGGPALRTGNGPFTFVGAIADGENYATTIGPAPAGHSCWIDRGIGTITGASVTDVAVHCPESEAKLAALSLSAVGYSPSFLPDHFEYASGAVPVAGVVRPADTTITATATQGSALLEINGDPVASGVASKPYPLKMGRNEFVIKVRNGDANSSYRVSVTGAFSTYVKASTVRAAADFGRSIATAGDWLVVGAPGESSVAKGVNGDETDTSAPDAGAAYVFTRLGASFRQVAYLKASNTRADARFGQAVAASGDTLVVGASAESSAARGIDGDQDDATATGAGAVYVFVRDGATWVQQAYLKASNTAGSTFFGTAVAISGDTIVVGAPGENSNAKLVNGDQDNVSAPYAGAAYVFTRTGATWSQQAYLKPSNTRSNTEFGRAVAISGDTVVVGSPYESSPATGVDGNQNDVTMFGAGAAYVFVRSSATWAQQAYLKASNTRAITLFGHAVAASGDTIAVGSRGESSGSADQQDTSQSAAGAVYVFTRSAPGAWGQQAYVKASNPMQSALFGASVALDGDRLLVGAPDERSDAVGVHGVPTGAVVPGAGAAYLYRRSGTTWPQPAYLKAPLARDSLRFGWSVAVSASAVVVGTPGDPSSASGIDGDIADDEALGSGAAHSF